MLRASVPAIVCFALLCALLPGCLGGETAASPGARITDPREYDAFWRTARYADLFSETLRTDGWKAEQMAVILMTRFAGDRKGFVRNLARATDKEAVQVGRLLAYNASYRDLGVYREQLTELQKELGKGKESQVIDTLLEQVAALESALGKASGTPSNLFDARKAKVGEKIAGLSVVSISEIRTYPRTDDNYYSVSVKFSGQATVSGTYLHDAGDKAQAPDWPPRIVFFPDGVSSTNLPRIDGDTRTPSFVFSNHDEAAKSLAPPGTSGKATVVIDQYLINRHPSGEGVNQARLVRVVEK